jgi:hypothetical protein
MEAKIFNPWNPVNKIIPDSKIHEILSKYGVKGNIMKPELFRKACVHKSYVDRSEEWAADDQGQILAERPPIVCHFKRLTTKSVSLLVIVY